MIEVDYLVHLISSRMVRSTHATTIIIIIVVILAAVQHLRLADACAATAANSPPITSSTKSASQEEEVTPSTSAPTTINGATAGNGSSCGVCQRVVMRRNDTNSRPVTQTPGTRANGCSTVTVMCEGTASDAAVILTWYDSQGNEVGSTFGSGTVQAVLICNRRNQLMLEGGIVNEVECISDHA